VAIIYIAMLIFLWKVYAGPSELGSTDKVWENLQIAAEKNPVKWNNSGSYLTMWSTQGATPISRPSRATPSPSTSRMALSWPRTLALI
jgi:Na+/proline symporter